MRKISFIFFLIGFFIQQSHSAFDKTASQPRVEIPELNVVFKGTTEYTTWTRKSYILFQNINYAKDPVDDLKFMPPVPVDEEFYEPISDQTNSITACYTFSDNEYFSDANCLSLSIATSRKQAKRPVIVYLAGNNIVSGTSEDTFISAGKILEENVVLVTVQYRVGFLGFLSTGTDAAPGNNGILDVIEALRWIKRYISHFGGDPEQVILMGSYHSAAIAHILTITPLLASEEDLFSKVILQSGTALIQELTTDDPLSIIKTLATLAKCSKRSPTIMIKCLKALEDEAFRTVYRKYVENNNGIVPLITVGGPSGVLPIKPEELLQTTTRRAYPILGGIAKHGGYENFEGDILGKDLETYRRGLESMVQKIHNASTNSILDHQKAIWPMKIFLNNLLIALVPTVVDMKSYHMKYSTGHVLKLNANKNSTSYLYAFNYAGNQNAQDSRFNGIFVGDEDKYIFSDGNTHFSRMDKRISQIIIELWTSFATTGTPTATELYSWPPLTEDKLGPYLIIGNDVKIGYKYDSEYFVTIKDEEKGIHIISKS